MENRAILKEDIKDLLLNQDNEKIIYISSSANNLQYYYSKLEGLIDLKYLSLNSYNNNEIMGININILDCLKNTKKSIILIDIYLALRVFFDKVNVFSFEKDKEYTREDIKRYLIDSGYTEQYMVEKKGEFSIRGDIIDIFPSNLDLPIRLDFFDDLLENIKSFSCYDQRSVDKFDKIDIYSNNLYGNEKEMIDLISKKDTKIFCENLELLEIKLEQILGLYKDINLKERFDNLVKESTLLQVIKSKNKNYQLEIKKNKEHLAKRGKKYEKADQIVIGDYVIHVEFGIGIYQGIVNINEREYLMVQYADSDKLYIPVEKLNRLSKYVSNIAPKLYSLGTKGFKRKEKKLKEEIEKFAQELINIQAKRKLRHKSGYNKDSLWQQEFEEEFEFELTADQRLTLDEVKKDLESDILMDRLVIGDVGYGKTEIAIRAAFKTIENGYQCAILAPTTVLANQHYERIHKRFEKYAIKVASFSRLSKDSKMVNKINNGEIDLIIGTHKLLSDNVKFKNLGLLIIDEEQKFGVTHKEKIKKKQLQTNLLTLSATPIPRTLNLALLGIKDISIINTAPINRLPIITEIIEHEEIRRVILQELTRDGQVFYITNNVKIMEEKKKELKAMLPEFVKIEYIHGQLKANEIKEKIDDFNEGKFDILIASTIIENGIDIPNANTIIIEKYTHLGLSQIYQLRGRVGRSLKQGYCYLLKEEYSTKKGKEKQKSLEKIEGVEGAGYFLSLEDLNIRGAGEILGQKQHGAIDTFGYDLYLKMLENEMKKLKGEKVFEFKDIELRLEDIGYIPDEYIKKDERILIYKRYSEIVDFENLKDLNEEIRDRFGKIPEKMQQFIKSIKIKIYLMRNEYDKIVEQDNSYILYKQDEEEIISKDEFENMLKSMLY